MEKTCRVLRITQGYGLFQRNKDVPRAVYYTRDKADEAHQLLSNPANSPRRGKPANLYVKKGWMLVVTDDADGDQAFWLGDWSSPLAIGVDTEAERLGQLKRLQDSGRAKLTAEEQIALGLPELDPPDDDPGDPVEEDPFDG